MGKKIWNVPPRLLDHECLDEELTRLGLATNGSYEARVERMFTWIDNNLDPDTRVDCDCGGFSDTTHFDRCPFCGDGEVEQEDGSLVPGTAIELADDGQVEVLTVASLDESVARINQLKSNIAKNYFHLGTKLKEVYHRGLWKLRTGRDGKAAYTDFAQWTRSEAGLGRTQALKMIDVAGAFTESEVREIGHTRLAVALQVPAEYRGRLVEKAREGASKRALERDVAEVRGKVTPSPERALNAITLAVGGASRTLPFMSGDGDGPAFCLGDKPIAEEVMSNDVVQIYQIDEDDQGRLVLHIRRSRLDQ